MTEIAALLDWPDELAYDIGGLPTPCYLIEEERLAANLALLAGLKTASGCRILLGQKGFAMHRVYPLLATVLDGTTASSLHELRLAADYFPGERQIYSPAYRPDDFAEIARLADVVIYNSFGELERGLARGAGSGRCGMRLNPEHSTQGGGLYDPCAPHSRLGITRARWDQTATDALIRALDGFHMHTLCEQNVDALSETVAALEERFGDVLAAARDAGRLGFLNLGGGHHITRPDYDRAELARLLTELGRRYLCPIYIEPGEAVALNTGWLITTVLAIEENGMPLAILDASAECHMPDVLGMPYRPHILGSGRPGTKPHVYRLGSASCLAGDVLGDYAFDWPLAVGDRLVLGDMAHYTMVKNNTFNGLGLPTIVLRRLDGELEIVRTFGYQDYRDRLS
ncbi:MAG: carboxynorspermidine decarboxylase [Bacillota bacterium]|nr:carboxynorspermidine decarboxylase [Bacillota bacterium]